MDPAATPPEPLPALPGFPFLHAGACAVIVGPTGGGRSSLVQAGLYDAARAGMSCAYLGGEVTAEEFNARAAMLAQRRGDTVDEQTRAQLARVRYLDLASVIVRAWDRRDPRMTSGSSWADLILARYQLIAIDPLSAVASALDLDFDKSNAEYVRFHDALIQPLVARGAGVVLVDNVGHDPDAKSRAKGASAKQDRADLTFSCSLSANPPGLIVKAGKVRSVRAPFRRGDEWLFVRDTQRIVSRERGEDDHASTFRPTGQMQRVSEAVEHDEGLSKRAIRTTVGGKATTVDLALELLIAEGYIAAEHDGRATRHTSLKPYREPTVSTVSRPCPAPCPDTPPSNRVPVSSPLREGHGHGHGPSSNGNSPTVSPDATRHTDGPETVHR
jgi:hypothetical protein